MVYERGIEVGQKNVKAIDEAVFPTTKTELQSLLRKINFIRRFISNLSERILPFSPLLKLKNEYMKCSPVLVPPQQGHLKNSSGVTYNKGRLKR